MIILDIRSKREFDRGHVCGATLIPTPLPSGKPPNLTKKQYLNLLKNIKEELESINQNKNIKIAIYCKKGVRSKLAHKALNYLGYYNIIDLGGIETKSFWNYQLPFCNKKHS
jgi:rhodanese-related sulfurtransferase